MLNPLVQWRDPAVVPEGRASFRLDRGRIIVCKGEAGRRCFDALWESGGEAAGARLLDLKRGTPALPGGEALFIRALAGREAGACLAEIEPLLEAHARDGGGILLALADEVAPPALTQVLLPAPSRSADAPRLLDDQGLALRYARQGDWVLLYWPLPADSLHGVESFSVRCQRGRDEWVSAPQPLAAWRPFTAGAKALAAELALPWPPGEYRLRLEFAGGADFRPVRLPPLALTVKSSAVNPLPHEFAPRWRLLGAQPVPAANAECTLLQADTRQLDLAPAATPALIGEWHGAEVRVAGGWRRWMGNSAQSVLRGTGGLFLDVEDHRPRDAAGSPTQVTMFLDGSRHARWSLAQTGAHRLSAAWPEDSLAHLVSLCVHPCWSPAEFGQPDDRRRLGLLINEWGLSP